MSPVLTLRLIHRDVRRPLFLEPGADSRDGLLNRPGGIDDDALVGFLEIKELTFDEALRHVVATSTIEP